LQNYQFVRKMNIQIKQEFLEINKKIKNELIDLNDKNQV
jgi:hypothetical protein